LAITRFQLFQLFKYGVYSLLALNVYLFFTEEFAAARLQFPDGIPPGHLIDAFAATIDTAAWLVLLLMFEAETNWLADHHYTRPVVLFLHGLRLFSYSFIVYAFYGYILNLQFVSIVEAASGISDLCGLVNGEWSYAVTLDQYEPITAASCAAFSSATEFFRYSDMPVLVDRRDFTVDTEIERPKLQRGIYLLGVLPDAWRSPAELPRQGQGQDFGRTSLAVSFEPLDDFEKARLLDLDGLP
jgi:hypothetical protein